MTTNNSANENSLSIECTTAQNLFCNSPLLQMTTGFTLITNVAYFIYLGRTVSPIIPKFVEFAVLTIGAGTQVAEVGFFSTPLAPNKASQSVSKLISTGTVGALTTTGVKRNTTGFATSVAPGTHLWAGIRTAMATTQPVIQAVTMDLSQGNIFSTAAAGVLTAAGPWTGALIAHAVTAQCPNLRGSLI